MSDPYNNQYNQQGQYGHPQQGGYNGPLPYNQQPQQGYNQGYPPQQPGYDSGYGTPAPQEGYGPPARRDSYGPPAAGGFQHGFQGHQVGAYDASNPQGHGQYYGQQQYPNYDPAQQYQQHHQPGQQGYDQQQGYNQGQHDQYRDPNAPPGSDFNAPGAEGADGERGLGSSLIGGVGGYMLGRQKNHGLLGAIGGAIAGNFIGNKIKEHGNHGSHGHHGGGGFGGSSWGGGRY